MFSAPAPAEEVQTRPPPQPHNDYSHGRRKRWRNKSTNPNTRFGNKHVEILVQGLVTVPCSRAAPKKHTNSAYRLTADATQRPYT